MIEVLYREQHGLRESSILLESLKVQEGDRE